MYITLKTKMSFLTALKKLNAGKCCGIRPGYNLNFLVLSEAGQGNTQKNGNGDMLCWKGDSDYARIRISQYQGEWFLVINTNAKD